MQARELEGVGAAEWAEVVDGETAPWGADGEQLQWRDKQRHVGVRGQDGRLLALAGAVVADVAVGEHEPFPVVGIGGVIVTRGARGRGLARSVLEAILELAGEMGPDRAMLFCRAPLIALYERFGFLPIGVPVSAGQPAGTIEVPMPAMWRPLRQGADWPAGAVEVRGLPF